MTPKLRRMVLSVSWHLPRILCLELSSSSYTHQQSWLGKVALNSNIHEHPIRISLTIYLHGSLTVLHFQGCFKYFTVPVLDYITFLQILLYLRKAGIIAIAVIKCAEWKLM